LCALPGKAIPKCCVGRDVKLYQYSASQTVYAIITWSEWFGQRNIITLGLVNSCSGKQFVSFCSDFLQAVRPATENARSCCAVLCYSLFLFVCSDVVSNKGQFPAAKGDANSFKSTGPLCRYAADLLPMLKLMVLPEHSTKLRLDEQVTVLSFLSFIFLFIILFVHTISHSHWCNSYTKLTAASVSLGLFGERSTEQDSLRLKPWT